MEKTPLPRKFTQDDKFLNALAEAFRLQESIIQATDLAIISTTPDGIITSFNKAAEDMLGYSAEELIGKVNSLVFHDLEQVVNRAEEFCKEMGADIEPVFDVLTFHARQQGQPHRIEWTLIRKDGSRFPALLSVTALREMDGKLTGYVTIPADLSERKKSSEHAKISEQKFKLLAENIPGAIYLCHNDEKYSMIYLNDHVKEITGYSAEDFISDKINFAKIFHPEDIDNIFKTVDEALVKKERFQLKYRIRHKSGELRWVEEIGVGVYVDDKLLMIEGFISDVTMQKQAEEKLQKFAAENLRVFNNPANINAIAGFDGFFKRVSPSCVALLGWSEEEICGQPFVKFVHPDDVEATRRAAEYIADGNNLYTFENRFLCKDGSYRWLLWGSAPDVKAKIIYASAIDITERKNSEEELLESKQSLESITVKLQEQNRQLDEFAHIISHNLRSPVGNIQALINLLDENSSMEDYKLIFDKLKNVSKNLGETMNDLMDTLKVRANTNIARVDIRFKDILDRVIQTLEGELIMAEASVTFDFNSGPTVQYPKAYMESIFQNLLTNAIKYRSANRKPKIHLESKVVGNYVELRVSDNGQGIDLERFGDKLFGLHKTFHVHQEARGVGLFLIKTQIEAMGGSITAQSKVDEGTTFIIKFKLT
jgi:PAS domain S-box-containing protein